MGIHRGSCQRLIVFFLASIKKWKEYSEIVHTRVLLLLFALLFFVSVSTTSGCDDGVCTSDSSIEFTETQDAPFLGWAIIGGLGAGRRRRHQLNNYDYATIPAHLN